jgi:hypothetical protein
VETTSQQISAAAQPLPEIKQVPQARPASDGQHEQAKVSAIHLPPIFGTQSMKVQGELLKSILVWFTDPEGLEDIFDGLQKEHPGLAAGMEELRKALADKKDRCHQWIPMLGDEKTFQITEKYCAENPNVANRFLNVLGGMHEQATGMKACMDLLVRIFGDLFMIVTGWKTPSAQQILACAANLRKAWEFLDMVLSGTWMARAYHFLYSDDQHKCEDCKAAVAALHQHHERVAQKTKEAAVARTDALIDCIRRPNASQNACLPADSVRHDVLQARADIARYFNHGQQFHESLTDAICAELRHRQDTKRPIPQAVQSAVDQFATCNHKCISFDKLGDFNIAPEQRANPASGPITKDPSNWLRNTVLDYFTGPTVAYRSFARERNFEALAECRPSMLMAFALTGRSNYFRADLKDILLRAQLEGELLQAFDDWRLPGSITGGGGAEFADAIAEAFGRVVNRLTGESNTRKAWTQAPKIANAQGEGLQGVYDHQHVTVDRGRQRSIRGAPQEHLEIFHCCVEQLKPTEDPIVRDLRRAPLGEQAPNILTIGRGRLENALAEVRAKKSLNPYTEFSKRNWARLPLTPSEDEIAKDPDKMEKTDINIEIARLSMEIDPPADPPLEYSRVVSKDELKKLPWKKKDMVPALLRARELLFHQQNERREAEAMRAVIAEEQQAEREAENAETEENEGIVMAAVRQIVQDQAEATQEEATAMAGLAHCVMEETQSNANFSETAQAARGALGMMMAKSVLSNLEIGGEVEDQCHQDLVANTEFQLRPGTEATNRTGTATGKQQDAGKNHQPLLCFDIWMRRI